MALNVTSVGMARKNRFFLCVRSRNCIIVITIFVIINIIVYILVVVNSVYLHSTHTPHSQRLQGDPHLESGSRSAVELFCGNSLCVKAIGCFRRGAPSLMFDGILNVSLSEEVSTTGVTQGNLKLILRPNSLDSHQKQIQEYEILY